MRPFVLSMVFLSSCASVVTLGKARTVSAGEFQFAVAASAAAVPATNRVAVGPQVEGALRWGLSERLDFGLHASLLGGGLEARLQLVRSTAVDVLVGVSAAYAAQLFGGDFFAVQSSVNAQVPVLVGINFGPDQQLIIGARVIYENYLAAGGQVGSHGLHAGSSLGFAFKVGSFELMPFAAFAKALVFVQTTPSVSGPLSNHRDISGQLGVALLH